MRPPVSNNQVTSKGFEPSWFEQTWARVKSWMFPGASDRAYLSSSTNNSGYAGGTYLPGSKIDWDQIVGDIWENSAVSIGISWAQRNFTQAPWRVLGKTSDKPIDNHPATSLLYRPNPFYSGRMLWTGSILSLMSAGEFFWLKKRNAIGRVVQLWYLPHFFMTPFIADSDKFTVTDFRLGTRQSKVGELLYKYQQGTTRLYYTAADIVHVRYTINPKNTLRGMSPLSKLYREIGADNEASVYEYAMLKNLGMPGVVISPAQGGNPINPDAAAVIKAEYQSKFSGDNRFLPLILPNPITLDQLGIKPSEMAIDRIRKVPETRIAGALGIPAMVLGFSSAENQAKFANMKEARESAAEEFLVPLYSCIADDLDMCYIGVWDFDAEKFVPEMGNPDTERFNFDVSKLRMLGEDVNTTAERAGKLYLSGVAMRSESREMVGLEVDKTRDEIFFDPKAATGYIAGDMSVDELMRQIEERNTPKPVPIPTGNGSPPRNGNGTGGNGATTNPAAR